MPQQVRWLSSHLVVWQARSREDGDLLSPSDTVHAVNGRNARLNHLLGVDPTLRVDWLTWCVPKRDG